MNLQLSVFNWFETHVYCWNAVLNTCHDNMQHTCGGINRCHTKTYVDMGSRPDRCSCTCNCGLSEMGLTVLVRWLKTGCVDELSKRQRLSCSTKTWNLSNTWICHVSRSVSRLIGLQPESAGTTNCQVERSKINYLLWPSKRMLVLGLWRRLIWTAI